MRKIVLAALAITLGLTACTTEDDDAADATTTSAAQSTDDGTTDTSAPDDESDIEPIVDPRAPGVTDTEIKVGVTYVDFTNLKDIVGFDHGDYEAAYQAVFDHYNAEGGVAGRTLVPIYSPVDPLASDGAAAACTRLAQDEQVFVAVGFFLDDNVLCYLETNGTAVIGGTMTADRMARADAPWFTPEPSSDTATAALQAMVDSGELDGTVGVIGSAGDEALYESALLPVLEEEGIEPAGVAYVDTSGNDRNATVAASETILQRFQQDGVDQILMIGNTGSFVPLAVARAGLPMDLYFGDLNAAQTYAVGEGNDLSVLDGAVSGGVFDATNEFLEMEGATAECVEIMTDAGLTLQHSEDIGEDESEQWASSVQACRNIALLVAMLEAAGTDLDYGTFQTAGYRLGEIELAGAPEPYFFGPPPSTDGDPPMYVYEWDPATQQMTRQDG